MDGVIDMAEIITWTDLANAHDAVAEGEIFAQGAHVEGMYEVRLRRHGDDMIAEVREGAGDWQPVDSDPDEVTGALGVISLRDVDTEVIFFTVTN